MTTPGPSLERSWLALVVAVALRPAPAALQLATLTDLSRHVVDLAQRRLERIAQRQAQLLGGVAAFALMADDDRAAARHTDLDFDLVHFRPLRIAMRCLHHHSAVR